MTVSHNLGKKNAQKMDETKHVRELWKIPITLKSRFLFPKLAGRLIGNDRFQRFMNGDRDAPSSQRIRRFQERLDFLLKARGR